MYRKKMFYCFLLLVKLYSYMQLFPQQHSNNAPTNMQSLKVSALRVFLLNLHEKLSGDKENIEIFLQERVLNKVPKDIHEDFAKQYFYLYGTIKPNLRTEKDFEQELPKRDQSLLKLGFEYGFSLEELINNNKIPKSYVVFYNAHILDLSNLKINSLAGINRITNSEKIKYLALNNNQLTSIEPNAFKGLEHLIEIEINDNCLTNIAIQAFTSLPNLYKLEIKNNSLSQKTKKNLRKFLPYISITF